MKKIILAIGLFIIWLWIVNAENINMKLVYKEAIVSRWYIRHNITNWESILTKIELYLNNIRKNKDLNKLKILNKKTSEALIKLRKKEVLTKIEKKSFELIKNLYFRSYIELQRKY